LSDQTTRTETTREANSLLERGTGLRIVTDGGTGLFAVMVEAVSVDQTVRTLRGAEMHGPSVLQMQCAVLHSTLPHIILQGGTLTIPAVRSFLKTGTGSLQTRRKPNSFVYHRVTILEWWELDNIAESPSCGLKVPSASL